MFEPNIGKYEEAIKKLSELKEFERLLLEYNKMFNLTSITEEKEIFYKHFLDSILGESLFPTGASVAEVGSGAGFPSIPLKILRNDLSFVLFESTKKKCDFLNLVVKELDLKNVTVVNMRAEDASKKEEYREKFDIGAARAVARLNTLSEYVLPFVKVGGKMIAYKGKAEEEVKEAKGAIRILGGREEGVFSYSLPEGYGERSLVVVKKEKPTPAKYPRGRGKERSSPLSD